MKTVGHISKNFLELTQTFVYQQIIRNTKYRHVVFAEKIMNEEIYPVPSLVKVKDGKTLSETIKRNNIDVLHAHFGPNALYALEAKKNLKLPMVTFFHGWDVRKFPNTRLKEYTELFRLGEAFAVPSMAIKNELILLGCPESKIAVCYLGIDMHRFSFTPRTLDSLPIRLISVGRLVNKKGHKVLIEALSFVEKEIPNFHLTIIGEGKLYNELQSLITQKNLSEKVSLVGSLPPAEIAKELRQAHIFCLASHRSEDGDMEGLPISILEAQATGLPIVSTRHSGIPEAVIEGRSALLAEENNPHDLAKQLLSLMSQPNNWAEFGAVGRTWVNTNFHADNQADRLNEVYRRLIGSEQA